MKFRVASRDGLTTLTIDGQLDALTAPNLRAEIDSIVESRPARVEVDLSNLRLIDSSGVGALVSLYKRARAEGSKVEITGLRDQPLAIFRLLRLDRVLIGAVGGGAGDDQKPRKSRT
jgi:anti-sigma B factor antagonist